MVTNDDIKYALHLSPYVDHKYKDFFDPSFNICEYFMNTK